MARAYTVSRSSGARGVFDSDITYDAGPIPIRTLTRFRVFEIILKGEKAHLGQVIT